MHNRQLHIEALERRSMFAIDWQNPTLRCDVNHDGTATPLDVLLIINSINRDGDRVLTINRQESDPYFDVNGDSLISSLDVLQLINALNRALPSLTVSSTLTQNQDAEQNGVVSLGTIKVEGQTGPNSKISITVTPDVGEPETQTKVADAQGLFNADLRLQMGVNRVRFGVIDEIGQVSEVGSVIRRGDLLSEWNASLANRLRTLGAQTANAWTPAQAVQTKPPGIARNLTMIYGSMFDAINSTQGSYEPFFVRIAKPAKFDSILAASSAARRVASSLYSDAESLSLWDKTFDITTRSVLDLETRQQSIAYGEQVADATLLARQNDGANREVEVSFQDVPGKWKPSSPNFEAVLPQWPQVDLFSIPSVFGFRPADPPSLTSNAYAQAVDQVMRLGSKNSSTRTDDQTKIAQFWADGSGTASPPGHWNQIAVDYMATRSISLVDQMRTMTLLNVAMADAGVVAWDAKYRYDLWRPVDAIHQADKDGNVATQDDSSWEPLLVTPAFPSYVSGHSSFSAAACAVLSSLFGGNVSFKTQKDRYSSWELAPINPSHERTYSSFLAAAEEAGLSRIYGGIHFSFDNTLGIQLGQAIGDYVVTHSLLAKT